MTSAEYRKYCTSEHWQKIREAAIWIADGKCSICGNSSHPLIVHHSNYSRLNRERPEDLVVLCKGCHFLFEVRRRKARGAPTDQKELLEVE